MATEKLRAELEIITKKAEADLERFDRKLSKVDAKVRDLGSKGGKALRPLGTGLSNATANASEFEKSMAAANARVIAFGASAGLVLQISRALKETVKATIEVEKALADINIVLNANSAGIQKFGDQLFKIAAKTGQSFKVVAAGATELARQGLATEQTLSRLNDAMILSRLTGMGAEEAVSSLTAAVNSFNKSGITSAQVVNKMAKVDQAFAVSSDDLAKAISRVGSSAVGAGVSMDELMAITTAVQQRTARGGAVIGNAFKTIFTRIQRTDVQKKLAAIGVATRDMNGDMLGGTKILQNLSEKFGNLSKAQQSQTAESVAGVFQVNILRSALGDLSNKYGIYNRALKESATATDQAYRKNEKLNETLDALVNKSLVNLTQAGAAIGGATLEPAITRVLNLVNGAIGAFQEGGMFEEFGKGLGKDLLKGLGSFISGPGLVLITVGISKLMINFASFAKTALMGILELNKGALARKGIEESVTAALMQQPGIIKQIEAGEISAATAAKDMLATMRAQNMQADKLRATTTAIAGSMMGMGARGGRGGGRPGRASGFIPNFANADGERTAAAMGGYRAGGIKSMSIPGQGSVMYNGAETVKKFPGFTQPAIMPPKKSSAGTNYKSAFGAAHGFDPYAGRGFIPNFNIIRALGKKPSTAEIGSAVRMDKISRDDAIGLYGYKGNAGLGLTQSGHNTANRKGTADQIKNVLDVKGQLGIVSAYGFGSGERALKSATTSMGQLGVFKEYVQKNPKMASEKIRFDNVQVSSLLGMEKNIKRGLRSGEDSSKKPSFSRMINEELVEPMARIGQKLVSDEVLGGQGPKARDIKAEMLKGGKRLLPKQSEGELFETAIRLALLSKNRFMASITGSETAPFDFEEASSPTRNFKKKLGFDGRLRKADAKRTGDQPAINSVIKKAYNLFVLNRGGLLRGKGDKLMPLIAGEGGSSKRLPMSGYKHLGKKYGPSFQRIKGGATPSQASGFIPNFMRFGAFGRGNVGALGSAKAVSSILGLNMKPSMISKMLSTKNVKGILSKKDAFMGSRTGQAMTKMLKSLVDGTARGLPLSVWVAESIALYGKAAVTNAMKMVGNLTKGQKIGTGIAFGEGFIPNYSPLGDALGRERAAGVPRSAIRIGSSPALASSANPGGLGVYNTFDEPAGLGQGISRSKRMGINPKSHGASGGLIPNFGWDDRVPAPARTGGGSRVPIGSAAKTYIIGDPKTATSSMRERLSGSKLESSSKSIAASAKDMKGAAGSMEGSAGKMFMLSTVGYMAAGPIMQGMGLEQGTQSGINSIMMKGMGAAMLGSQLGVGATGLQGLGGATASSFRGGAPAIGPAPKNIHGRSFGKKMWDATKGAGRQLVGMSPTDPSAKDAAYKSKGGLKGGAKAVGKGAMKLGAKALPVAGWTWAGYDIYKGATGGWAETPEEKTNRVNQENLEKAKEEDYRPILEQLGSSTLGFAGGFGTTSGKVRTQQYAGLEKIMYGEGGAMDRARPQDREKLEADFQEFGQSFSQGAGSVETAAEKFNKAILKVAKSLGDAVLEAENQKRRTDVAQSLSSGKMQKKFHDVQRVYMRDAMAEIEFVTMQEESPKSKKAREEFLVKNIMDSAGGPSAIRKRITDRLGEEKKTMLDQGIDPEKAQKTSLHIAKGLSSLDLWTDQGKTKKNDHLKDYFGFDDSQMQFLHDVGQEDPQLLQRVEKLLLQKQGQYVPSYRQLENSLTPADPNEGPEQISSMGWRISAAETKKKLGEDKALFEVTRAQVQLLQTKNLKEREYQDALDVVTRGLYGEGDIKLRETKRKLNETYEREIELSKHKVAAAKKQATVDLDTVMADAISPVNDHKLQLAIIKGVQEVGKMPENTLTTERGRVEALLKDVGEDPSSEDRRILEAKIKAIDVRLKSNQIIDKETKITKTALTEKETGLDIAKADNDISRVMIDAKFRYTRNLDLQTKAGEARLAKEKASFSKRDLESGRITGSNFAAQQREARSKARDAGGLKGKNIYDPKTGELIERAPGAPMASIGTIFKEEWAYGPRSQTEEFEDGMADVARTVKSSLKTAIKDIVSGAESFEDGMYRVFAALADKLADQGISMGVNSLFGMFGGSRGGMVPRGYNQGGMVRGGSGTRDDVLTYMQGGEYVIKKSAVNQIPGGEATLNAINGGNARGGFVPGYGGGGRANVSLAKEFLFNDPKRPTSGGYNVSGALSTSALFRGDDPQTANTIGKQAKFVQYQDYRRREQERRDKIIEDIERKKKGRLYNAYLSAALRVGAGALSGAGNTTPTSTGGGGDPSGWGGYGAGAGSTSAGTYPTRTPLWGGTDAGSASGGYIPGFASGGPARVMGGEYIMSAGATAQHGTAFMSQLNRGRLPGFQEGGLVGGGGAAMAAGITTNNVNLSINIDKAGGAEVSTEKSGKDRNKNDERSTSEEAEDSKKLAEGIRNAVLKEIITQQRPGGLLRDGASASGLRTGG